MELNYKFTIFTACFNSEPFINRLYESLKAQSFTDFEWLIIDDCSQDATRDILELIKIDAPFDVRIFYNDSNKMIASCCNFAVKNALGEFFFAFLIILLHSLFAFSVTEHVLITYKSALSSNSVLVKPILTNCLPMVEVSEKLSLQPKV